MKLSKDIMSVKNIPGVTRIKVFTVIGVLLMLSGVACFCANFFSPYGKFKRDYDGKLSFWSKAKMAARMAEIDMAFKISPMMNELRNRD
jgi:hypothetical protein